MGPAGTGTPASLSPQGHSRGGETTAGEASVTSSMDAGVRPQEAQRGQWPAAVTCHITQETGGGVTRTPAPSATPQTTCLI